MVIIINPESDPAFRPATLLFPITALECGELDQPALRASYSPYRQKILPSFVNVPDRARWSIKNVREPSSCHGSCWNANCTLSPRLSAMARRVKESSSKIPSPVQPGSPEPLFQKSKLAPLPICKVNQTSRSRPLIRRRKVQYSDRMLPKKRGGDVRQFLEVY